jgi:hypothetical protein
VPDDNGAPGQQPPGARTDRRSIPADQGNGDSSGTSVLGTFPFEYADDYVGNIPADQLTESEEDYRRRAYEAACHYAGDYLLRVFPVWWVSNGACACPAGARCENTGKHPIDQSWPDLATDDPEEAARWWRPRDPAQDAGEDWRPKANIGLMMGQRCFLLDMDVDGEKTGDASLETLIAHHGQDMVHTLCYRTGSGGRQFVMLAPPDTEVRNSVSELADYLDIRGHHGYGIAPPSVSGKGEYSLIADVAPQPPPGWLADWLREQQRKRTERLAALPKGDDKREAPAELSRRARAYVASALESAAQRVAETPMGERNKSLNTEAFNIFSRFGTAGLLDPGEIATAFKAAAESCQLHGAEIVRTLRSSFEGAQAKPRSGELPDFVFETASPPPKVPPSITSAVYSFERMFQLRRSVAGEFVSRPESLDEPALVSDIGDEMNYVLRRWWRGQAESWNESVASKIGKIDPDKPDKDDEDAYITIFPPDATFSNTISHLKASATGHPPVIQHIRCFDDPDRAAIIVDLCDDTGMVVEITPDGFRVRDPRQIEGRPWFRRGGDMAPQMRPEDPGDIYQALEEARFVLGVDREPWRVILGGLIGSYFPSIDKPGWWLSGPSGSGKTTRGRMISSWVDPARYLGGRLNIKRDERNARVRAVNRYVLSMDNVTAISADESDFWCTLHTGVSEAVRKLHSDNTLLAYEYRRIGLATSLVLPDTLGEDALRRTLHIELPAADHHPDSSLLWRRYDAIKSRVLGAVFTILAGVLRELGGAEQDLMNDAPEMADYSRRLFAADKAYPGLKLYESYSRHVVEVMLARASDDQFAVALRKWLESMPSHEVTGTAGDLHERMGMAVGFDTTQKWWPKDGPRFSSRLTKLHIPLALAGIMVEKSRSKSSRDITIRLTEITREG